MPLLDNYFWYLLIPVGALGLFLLLREFNCWYWKINRRLALLEEIAARLERLEAHLLQEQKPASPRLPEITID